MTIIEDHWTYNSCMMPPLLRPFDVQVSSLPRNLYHVVLSSAISMSVSFINAWVFTHPTLTQLTFPANFPNVLSTNSPNLPFCSPSTFNPLSIALSCLSAPSLQDLSESFDPDYNLNASPSPLFPRFQLPTLTQIAPPLPPL